MDSLYMVIPAYNEAANIVAVAREWHAVIAQHGPESRLVIIDDGSKDDTYSILQGLRSELPQLIALTKPNSGHGATLLYGYRYALEQGADYIFQTDSDGQTLPEEFPPFWEKRRDHAMVIGSREGRQDGFSRVVVTKVLKLVLWCVFGLAVRDANTPYRLVQRAALEKYIDRIPKDFFLSNVMLTVLLTYYKEPILYLPITFRLRQGGVNSINLPRIFKIGRQAVRDFWHIRCELRRQGRPGQK